MNKIDHSISGMYLKKQTFLCKAVVLHTMVQGDQCTEYTAQGKDAEVQADYITNPRAAQKTDVSTQRRSSLKICYFLKKCYLLVNKNLSSTKHLTYILKYPVLLHRINYNDNHCVEGWHATIQSSYGFIK